MLVLSQQQRECALWVPECTAHGFGQTYARGVSDWGMSQDDTGGSSKVDHLPSVVSTEEELLAVFVDK